MSERYMAGMRMKRNGLVFLGSWRFWIFGKLASGKQVCVLVGGAAALGDLHQ
jgi:hypothetical protein